LQSHRQETSKLSTDPQFAAKTRDIVGLYPDLPLAPGIAERRTHDYERHCTTTL
jgi:hypothetical protein